MFKKLLKYDMKAIWNVWWILAVSVLGVSTVAAFLLRFVIRNITDPTLSFPTSIAMLVLFLLFMGIFMSILVTELLVHFRFYKNFYTDEGYLTFTLPTSRKMLLASKAVNALIWECLHLVLYLICALIFFVISPPPADGGVFNPVVFERIGSFFSAFWGNHGAWTLLYALEVLLLTLLSGCFSISLIQFCITVGSVIAKKMKLLAAIGIYYLVNMVLSFLFEFVFVFGGISLVDGMIMLLADANPFVNHMAISVALLCGCAITATLACTFYCMTLSKLERKLNLA